MNFVQRTVPWAAVMITFILQHHGKALAHVLCMISYNLGFLELLFVLQLLFLQFITPTYCTYFTWFYKGSSSVCLHIT